MVVHTRLRAKWQENAYKICTPQRIGSAMADDKPMRVTRALASAISAFNGQDSLQLRQRQPIRRRQNARRRTPNVPHRRQRVHQRRETIDFGVQVDIPDPIYQRRQTIDFGVQVNMPGHNPTQRQSISIQAELAIDDPEEVWCICRQAQGDRDMIGCDNSQCLIQWFHFDCMGIQTAPENNWYCYNCAHSMNRS